MAKTLEDLQESRDRRSEISLKYGFIPTSIIEAEKARFKAKDSQVNMRNYEDSGYCEPGTWERNNFGISGKGCQSRKPDVEGGALSRYPQNIGRYLVKMYSSEGDTILDPFAGHNSRMELCYKLGRNYIGYDISAKFMESNRLTSKTLQGSEQQLLFTSGPKIQLFEQDSRYIKLDNPADMSFTSPPYWDIEFYGDEKEQLGKCQSYDSFIRDLSLVIDACYKNIKPGAFCCWSINDFRKNGVFYAYHASVIELFLKVGFKLHDIVIVDLGYPIGAAFATQLEAQKRTAKRHEYIIIGQK